jgi:hydrogenase maturation factor HypF (carbamoyltransferase family)
MEYNNALKLKQEWGDKPCSHDCLEKVYYAGAFLISYVCTRCGTEFTIAEKLEMDLERKKTKTPSGTKV